MQFALTGTVAITNGSPNVVGTGTAFTTQLQVGWSIVVGAQTRVINTISDDTHLATTTNFTSTASGQSAQGQRSATGTVAIADLLYVVGTGAAFTTEIEVGMYITIGGATRIVDAIIDNNLLVVTVSFSIAVSGALIAMKLVNVETLNVIPPKGYWKQYTRREKLGDAAVKGFGTPMVKWEWGYLTRDQRNALRIYCPEASAPIYIQTPTRDDDDAYAIYQANMVWPEDEENDTTRRMGFILEFTAPILWP